MKKLLFIALVAAGMTACMQNEELAAPKGDAIAFENAYVGNSVRAAVDPSQTTNSINSFNVWGFMNNVGGAVFEGTEVTKNGNVWGYVGTQYWMPEKDYYFAALSPANAQGVKDLVLATGDDAKLGLGSFTYENDGKVDLLYAAKHVPTPTYATLASDGMPAVALEFQHLLSKVKFTFVNGFGTDNTSVVVTGLQMTAPQSATIDLTGTEGWARGSETVALSFGDVGTLSKANNNTAECANECLTIPASADYTYNVTFNVDVYVGTELAYSTPKEATISGYALEMGKAYNFTAEITPANLGLAPIEFTATVKEWDTVADTSVDYYYDSATNTYSVASAAGLKAVAAKINAGELNANVVLLNDIDLAESRSTANWTPIGLSSDLAGGKTFRGTFDGKGHTISNMVCERNDVAGLFGYIYAATIKNVTIENATIVSNHFAGGIVAWVNNIKGNIQVPAIIENCHVVNSTIVSTPELVNGSYDNGDKVGGLIGAAWFSDATWAANEGAKVANCSVVNTTVKAYRDLGGLFGLAQGVYAENCLLLNVTVNQSLTNAYKDEVPTTVGDVIGRNEGGNVINGANYVKSADALAAALTADAEEISVALTADIDLPITSLGQQTPGSGEYKLGGLNTKNITIDLGGNKLNITTGYWSCLGAKNNNATITIKNGTMTSSQATGTWNSYDLDFTNCNYNFENVVFEKAIALTNARKVTNIDNVTINETHDYYALWISANGQSVYVNGLTVNSAGRGIKIDEQYVSAPAKVTLNIANSTFKSVKKAAIVVKSVAGAEVNVSNLNIAEVAADDTFAVWVDEDSAAYADKVVVNGAPCKVEGAASLVVESVEDLNKLSAKNTYVVLKADIDFGGAAMAKPIEIWGNSTFDGNGHKISNVKTAVQGGYATSLFRGDANAGNKVVKNLVVENLSTPAGYSYAAAIWSDLQGANIEIDNVHINNATIAAKGTIGGFVGFVSGSTTSVVIKNSSISNSTLNGGEADHKRGVVVGRAYGCVAACENVVVDNVKLNDVAATTSTLAGDKGYTGTVTVK